MNHSTLLAFVAALAAACADGTLPPRTADDPANPNAVEAPILSDAASAPPGPAAADDGGTPNPVGNEHHHYHPTPSPSNSGGTP
jgi:hypothetical protein